MSETALFAAARLAVATALSGVSDWSENPNKLTPKSMPAFCVEVERIGSEPVAAGSAVEDVDLTIRVDVFQAYGRDQNGKELAGTQAETARAAILSDPDIRALTYWRQGDGFETDSDPGEDRYATATVTVSVKAEF